MASITRKFLKWAFENGLCDVNDFESDPKHAMIFYPWIECSDGFVFSCQAGYGKYSEPRTNITNFKNRNYSEVELGYPSTTDELISEYADGPEWSGPTYRNPSGYEVKQVYAYVPVEVVDKLIEKHGGIKRISHERFDDDV